MGSGRAASPSPSARNARSAAAIATEKGILSRNASSGTTRISVGERSLQTALRLTQRFPEMMELFAETEPEVVRQAEMLARNEQHAMLGPHPLDQVEAVDPRAVLDEADRPGLRGVPAERVAEPLQPFLERGVVRDEDPPGAFEHLAPHLRFERDGGEIVARACRSDRRVVVTGPRFRRERGWGYDPADAQAGEAVRLRQPAHDDHPLVAAPERRRRDAVALSALVHLVREQPRPDLRGAAHDDLAHLVRKNVSRRIVGVGHHDELRPGPD